MGLAEWMVDGSGSSCCVVPLSTSSTSKQLSSSSAHLLISVNALAFHVAIEVPSMYKAFLRTLQVVEPTQVANPRPAGRGIPLRATEQLQLHRSLVRPEARS
jgi:hypothetical protein